jgi:hypothetical protein
MEAMRSSEKMSHSRRSRYEEINFAVWCFIHIPETRLHIAATKSVVLSENSHCLHERPKSHWDIHRINVYVTENLEELIHYKICITLYTVPDYYVKEIPVSIDIQCIGEPLPVDRSQLLSRYICNYSLYSQAVSFSPRMQTRQAAVRRNLADSCEHDTELQ